LKDFKNIYIAGYGTDGFTNLNIKTGKHEYDKEGDVKRAVLFVILAVLMLIYASTTEAGCLQVTSPNGGEHWFLGTSQNIIWSNSCGKAVKIVLKKGASGLGNIATNLPASRHSYQWQAGKYQGGKVGAGNDYRILIKTMDNSESDTSNEKFSIAKINASTQIRVSAYRNIDLVLKDVYSDSCPSGDIIQGADAFYMQRVKIRVYIRTKGLIIPSFKGIIRVRVGYFDMNKRKSVIITRDYKPDSINGPIEVISHPIFVKRALGLRVGIIPLGRFIDNNMADNTMVVNKCSLRNTSNVQEELLKAIQSIK